jgi:hypothetical protein
LKNVDPNPLSENPPLEKRLSKQEAKSVATVFCSLFLKEILFSFKKRDFVLFF